MRPRAAALESLHTAALGLWLGALVLSGAAAAILFPTMHTLDPRLPAYAGYSGPHWSLAAGTVANRIFGVAGLVELVCAAVFFATFVSLVFMRAMPRWWAIGRSVIAGTIAATAVLSVIPSAYISAHLSAYDRAARAGDSDVAEHHRAAIASFHSSATTLMGTLAALLVVALVASIISTARSSEPEPR